MDDLIALAIELGCDAYKAIPFIQAGRGKRNEIELCLGKDGALRLGRILLEKSKALIGQINISSDSTFPVLFDQPTTSEWHDGLMTCSAGYDTLSIGANGTAYPCPFLRDFPLGNLLSNSWDEIWHESTTLNELRRLNKKEMTGPCSTCKFAPEHCHGGCRASAYHSTGNLKSSDPLCFQELLTIDQGR